MRKILCLLALVEAQGAINVAQCEEERSVVVFETGKGKGSTSLCDRGGSRGRRAAAPRALALPLQKQKVAGKARGRCRKAKGKHGARAPGSRSTEKAGRGEQD